MRRIACGSGSHVRKQSLKRKRRLNGLEGTMSMTNLNATLPIPPSADVMGFLTTASPSGSQQIEHVANGFESLFASMLVKEMRQTLEPGTLFGSDGSDVMGGMFDLFFGQHLAKAGALGIAPMVKKQLEKHSG